MVNIVTIIFTCVCIHIYVHITIFLIRCLSSSFCIVSRRFFVRARVGDDILNFSGLLIALATLATLCLIISVMVSLMVAMSSSTCVFNRFLNSN